MSHRTHRPSEESRKKRKFSVHWAWGLIALIAVAGAVAGILLSSANRSSSQTDALSPPDASDAASPTVGSQPGKLAPDFRLLSLAGEPVRLSAFRGRFVILDFWASWCAPCKTTFPRLHALWRRVADRGVILIGVSLDRHRTDAEAYLDAAGFDDMIAVWESRAAALAVADRYDVEGIPHTLVIDPDGIVRYKGHPTGLTLERMEAFLEAPRS